MKEFKTRYLNYNTVYKSMGDYNATHTNAACFGGMFYANYANQRKVTNCYIITMNRDVDNCLKMNNNNYCFFSPKEVITYMEYLKAMVDFEYDLSVCPKQYKITVFCKKNLLTHKFLLTCIRHLYEAPFSLCLYETLKILKETKVFKDEPIINVFNIVFSTNKPYIYGNSIHAVVSSTSIAKLLDYNQITEALDKNYNVLHDMFPTAPAKVCKQFVTLQGRDCQDSSQWVDKNARQERLKVYIKNYNLLKDKAQNE